MPSDLDIEILTIDDSTPPIKTSLNKTKNPLKKKKWRTMRKSTGVGGKAPHSAIPFKPLRKVVAVQPPSPKKPKNVDPEYFDVEDDEDSDDEIQVIENDPLNDVEVLSDGASDGFCDICGLFLENAKDMESHHGTVHQLVTCKWCQSRLGISEIKNHIGSKLCPNFTKLLGSHCSVHNEIETDEKLEKEEFKNCRPLRCDACSQRYDRKSLRDFDEQSKSYICPGCLHGRIESPESDEDVTEVLIDDDEKQDEVVPSTPSPKVDRPVPEFLSTSNPIPLPEILLLDDFDQEDDRAGNASEQEASTAIEKIESGTPCKESRNKSELVKKKDGSLTSKLVELINTELQEKTIADKDVSMEEVEVNNVVTSVSRNANDSEEEIHKDLDDIEIISEEISSPTNEGNKEVTVVECPREDESNEHKEESPMDNDVRNESTEEVDSCSVIEIIENSEVVANGAELSVENEESVNKNAVDEILVENDIVLGNEFSTDNCETRLVEDIITKASVVPKSDEELVNTEMQSPSITTPARRVARKSTKPPQKPQRITENLSELLLFENLNTNATPSSTLSPKRKLASPTTSRKVARKSTRPPNNPQRTLFSEDKVESEKTNLDDDAMDCALLLATPEKAKGDVELEVLDELVG